MVGLRIEEASLWDGLDCRGSKGRKFVRWANSSLEDSKPKIKIRRPRTLMITIVICFSHIKTKSLWEFGHLKNLAIEG